MPGLEWVSWKFVHAKLQARDRCGLQAWTVCHADLIWRPVMSR